MTLEWAALLGEYALEEGALVFKGHNIDFEGQPGPAIGNFLCNQWFTSGTIEAQLQLAEIQPHTSCALILSFDLQSKAFLTAGLGGPGMYSIRSFAGKWTVHDSAGEHSNLRPNHPYRVRATVAGSRVALFVDGVEVLLTQIPFSLQRSQVGVFVSATHEVRISDFQVHGEVPRAFVVMQYSSPYNEIYSEVIQRVCAEPQINVAPRRADEAFGPGVVIADIARQIIESQFVIAEISPGNPNVYYEVGFAHALRKPTILIAEKGTPLPFDVSPFRILFYENTIHGKARFEEGLRRHITAIIGTRAVA